MLNIERPLTAVEEVAHVITFLQEAMCAPKELPFSDNALCGLQHVFFALLDDLKKLREHIANNP